MQKTGPNAGDIVAGIFVGFVAWFILSLLIIIPLIGWIIAFFIAPFLAGYIAGRLGEGKAVIVVALLAPLTTFALGALIVSMIPFAALQTLGYLFLGAFAGVWAIFNLIFVGAGGLVGKSSRRKHMQPPVAIYQQFGQQPMPGWGNPYTPNSPSPTAYQAPPPLPQTGVQTAGMTDKKKLILGYILVQRKLSLDAAADRFQTSRQDLENTLFEFVAEGKIQGSMDEKTGTFTLEKSPLNN